MKALRDASWLFNEPEFADEADRMRGGLRQLFDEQSGCFYIAKDRLGPIRGINSDGLNMLSYLKPHDITFEQLEDIILASTVLEVTSRVLKFLDTNPETLRVRNGIVEKAGCDPQLWTVTAKEYFNSVAYSTINAA